MKITNVNVDKKNNIAYFEYDGVAYKMSLITAKISFVYDGKDKRIVEKYDGVEVALHYDNRHSKLLDLMDDNADQILDLIIEAVEAVQEA